MTPTLADFPYLVCSPAELAVEERRYLVRVPIGRLRATALRICAEEYRDGDTERSLARKITPQKLRRAVKREGYGSAVLMFILAAVVGEIIAFCTERLLHWLWPDKSSYGGNEQANRLALIARIQAEKLSR